MGVLESTENTQVEEVMRVVNIIIESSWINSILVTSERYRPTLFAFIL
jgi:hypothetical protein